MNTSSQRNEQSLCILSILWILTIWYGYVNCSILYKEDGLQINICACYSLEMSLYIIVEVSSDNMWDWEGLRKEWREVNNTKAYAVVPQPTTSRLPNIKTYDSTKLSPITITHRIFGIRTRNSKFLTSDMFLCSNGSNCNSLKTHGKIWL
jgi:hypothetical protein